MRLGLPKQSGSLQIAPNRSDAITASHVRKNTTNQAGRGIARRPSHLDRVSPSAWRHLSSPPLDLLPIINQASSTRMKAFLFHPPTVSNYPRVTGPQAGAARLEDHGIAKRVGSDSEFLHRQKGRGAVRCGGFSELDPA